MMKKVAIAAIIGIIGLFALGYVYYSGAFAIGAKGIGKAIAYVSGDSSGTFETGDSNVVVVHAKTIDSQNLYYGKSGHSALDAPAIESQTFAVNASMSGQFALLDKIKFVLAPDEAQVFTFTINDSSYPLRFKGNMQTSSASSSVSFSLIEAERFGTFARMTAGYSQFGSATTSDFIRECKFCNNPYVDVRHSDIGPNSKDSPTFIAVFENTGVSDQTITATLQVSYKEAMN